MALSINYGALGLPYQQGGIIPMSSGQGGRPSLGGPNIPLNDYQPSASLRDAYGDIGGTLFNAFESRRPGGQSGITDAGQNYEMAAVNRANQLRGIAGNKDPFAIRSTAEGGVGQAAQQFNPWDLQNLAGTQYNFGDTGYNQYSTVVDPITGNVISSNKQGQNSFIPNDYSDLMSYIRKHEDPQKVAKHLNNLIASGYSDLMNRYGSISGGIDALHSVSGAPSEDMYRQMWFRGLGEHMPSRFHFQGGGDGGSSYDVRLPADKYFQNLIGKGMFSQNEYDWMFPGQQGTYLGAHPRSGVVTL